MLGIAYVMEPGGGMEGKTAGTGWYGVDMVDYRGRGRGNEELK